ncbi:MAG: hypothetical protein ACHQX3_10755, partial [Nitrospirales bacterium]
SYQLTASQPALSPVLHHFTILFQKVPLLSPTKRSVGNNGILRGRGRLRRASKQMNKTQETQPL